jgi:hypothetical protein
MVYNLSATVTLNEYAWLFIFWKVVIIFIQIMDVLYIVHPLTFMKCQNNKEGSKILLKFNMINGFSLHNLGSRLFLSNMEI